VRRASRYQRLLAREQGAASVYRALAQRRSGEEREILLALARAEERHAAHWAAKLHPSDRRRHRPGVRARTLGWLARRLGSLVVLGLVQRAEAAGDYDRDPEATAAMAADEQTHALVVAGLTQRAHARSSGWFRAAVFGANDGLVSNFSLVLGMAGAGSSPRVVLLAGLAGLLSGSLSMAAGEYVSVRSQRELLEAASQELDRPTLLALADQEAEDLGWSSGPGGWRSTRPSDAPRRCAPEATTNRRAGTAAPSSTRPAPTWSGRRWGRPGSASWRSPPGPPSRSCRSS
jgi:hypothetical protein